MCVCGKFSIADLKGKTPHTSKIKPECDVGVTAFDIDKVVCENIRVTGRFHFYLQGKINSALG